MFFNSNSILIYFTLRPVAHGWIQREAEKVINTCIPMIGSYGGLAAVRRSVLP